MTVFMMACQLRLTGPSEKGMSTELNEGKRGRGGARERQDSQLESFAVANETEGEDVRDALEPLLDIVELV